MTRWQKMLLNEMLFIFLFFLSYLRNIHRGIKQLFVNNVLRYWMTESVLNIVVVQFPFSSHGRRVVFQLSFFSLSIVECIRDKVLIIGDGSLNVILFFVAWLFGRKWRWCSVRSVYHVNHAVVITDQSGWLLCSWLGKSSSEKYG